MAGTDEDAVAAADDALYVLTAVLLTPAKFPSVLGDDYPEACAALGLPPLADGYGLVLGQDGDGARWTAVVDDVSLVAVAVASWDCGMEYDLSPDERTVVTALPGWPLAVAVAAPGVPLPHDPGPESADQPALCPPDTTVWGPAQRRLGADEIALQWAQWREQIDDAEFPAPDGGAGAAGGAGGEDGQAGASGGAGARADATEEADGTGGRADAESSGHNGVRRVLAEARAYVDTPPPLGRVRSSFAPGDARTLRADGPGWSLVARTDDIAFILLDDEPGEVLPVGRGPSLPGLLEALDKMAVRPS
ncbi:Integral membrane protein OS=Streptomyces tendae OX=1932 GN=GUR47_29300 PE=4 SV=1 [Streptomyces tendae]